MSNDFDEGYEEDNFMEDIDTLDLDD